jgi:hypothetical protein
MIIIKTPIQKGKSGTQREDHCPTPKPHPTTNGRKQNICPNTRQATQEK